MVLLTILFYGVEFTCEKKVLSSWLFHRSLRCLDEDGVFVCVQSHTKPQIPPGPNKVIGDQLVSVISDKLTLHPADLSETGTVHPIRFFSR